VGIPGSGSGGWVKKALEHGNFPYGREIRKERTIYMTKLPSRSERKVHVFASLALALFVAVPLGLLAATAPPAVGSSAPNFTLKNQEGLPMSLTDFKGKWVVLYFYPKDFTRGCTIQAHGYTRDMAMYEKKNAIVVGVSVDSVQSHTEFCDKEGISFKLLSDEDTNVSEMYGSLNRRGDAAMAARNTFVIDPKGAIAKVFLSVDPNKSSEETLAALEELQK
jgi:peroxiredoxin Q/BCP